MTTQANIREALPASGRGSWRDEVLPGLELLGNRAGATWYIRHRVGGKRLRDRVGRWPALDLQAARKAARVRLEAAAVKVAAGADVMAERRKERTAKAERRKAVTLGKALDLYRTDQLLHLRSGKHAEQVIRLVFGGLMDKALPDLARSDLTGALEKKRRTAPATAETALRYAKPFFGWIAETERGADLLAGLKAKQTRKRDRTLSLRELGTVLTALDAMGDHPGALAAKALLATAGRLHEAARMEVAEVDLDAREWQLPAARNKSARVHVVPLNAEAVAAIRAALAGNTGSPFVFEGATGKTPFSGWSKLKARVDAASGIAGWTWHDARRTFVTICADRGIDAHVADRVLNHTGAGTSSTVQRVYQRSELLAARRAALDVWAVAMGEARVLASSPEVAVLKVRR